MREIIAKSLDVAQTAPRPRKPSMINDRLKRRLQKDRPSTTITMRIPADAVESLKAVALIRGFRAYQTLLKSYISEGLRRDKAALDDRAFTRRAARQILRRVEWRSKRRKPPPG